MQKAAEWTFGIKLFLKGAPLLLSVAAAWSDAQSDMLIGAVLFICVVAFLFVAWIIEALLKWRSSGRDSERIAIDLAASISLVAPILSAFLIIYFSISNAFTIWAIFAAWSLPYFLCAAFMVLVNRQNRTNRP